MLKNKDPFVPLLIERKRGETQLFAKEVTVEDRRYVVCRNEAEAEKDRRDRQAILAALQDALRRGEKALIGNTAYRRYLRKSSAVRGERVFEIDVGKLAEEATDSGVTGCFGMQGVMTTLPQFQVGSAGLATPQTRESAPEGATDQNMQLVQVALRSGSDAFLPWYRCATVL